MNKSITTIKRALISVYDKTGIIELAKYLSENRVEILSTGGTAEHLRKAGIGVIDVSDYTGFPEIMDGRIKTINPKIEGGILGLRDVHKSEAETQNIKWIDLVVCNLYPFADTISKPNVSLKEALKNIDIGGPTMIRSAAKNIKWVGVLVNPSDYQLIINEFEDLDGLSFETRKLLSAKAFGHCAQYDTIIHNYLKDEPLSDKFSLSFNKSYDLRYGENPHQKATAYKNPLRDKQNILDAIIHQGKKLSYNNLMDADASLSCLREFSEPTCVVIKHGNPCGVASGDDITNVYKKAFAADSKSAFGGIIALNRTCNKDIAEMINKVFVEIVIAPDYDSIALNILSNKKNLRVLEIDDITYKTPDIEYRYISGGLLVQESDVSTITENQLKTVTEKKPSTSELADLLFAWKVLKHVKSNAIITVKDKTTLGIGAGQVSRVDAVEIALKKSGNKLENSVLASDAFFPFRDSIDLIANTGVTAIIQPGGSIRDQEVIQACNEHGIIMVFSGKRCFKH
ncbi:MAG: bifunctional phosphoribosylaminoimidazolecarboxamide formyltransferase/IMP cyclohydrolase [Planctomycetia bacterium]|nr:bifunctional phosphoribosylaminoimidazolecarboxamide formyltransferase/IMP cyclohydrolase [Planctomycetia bacterium]